MFEPLKLITLGLAVLLLAPFGLIFWLMATHQFRPDAEVRASLESALHEHATTIGSENSDGSIVAAVGIQHVETIAFTQGTAAWLSFHPHRWVGWAGLLGVTIILIGVLVSLFVPSNSQFMMVEDQAASPTVQP